MPGIPENSTRHFTYKIDEPSNHAWNFASLIKTCQAKHLILLLSERPENLSEDYSFSLDGLIVSI
jgi:hypothetical protein